MVAVLVCHFGYVYFVVDVLALREDVLYLLLVILLRAEEEAVKHFVFYALLASPGGHTLQRKTSVSIGHYRRELRMPAQLSSLLPWQELLDGTHQVPSHSDDLKDIDLFFVIAASCDEHFLLARPLTNSATLLWQ